MRGKREEDEPKESLGDEPALLVPRLRVFLTDKSHLKIPSIEN